MGLTRLTLCFVVLLSLLTTNSACAHAFDPSLLVINKVADKEWDVFWQRPDLNGTPLPLDLELPSSCSAAEGKTTNLVAAVWVSKWRAICESSSFTQPLVISGLDSMDVSVVVRYWASESSRFQTYLIQPDNPSIILEAESNIGSMFMTYAFLGFEHILEGWDHLLFLFALILLIRRQRQLIIAITSFTIAHSITLFISTMNVINFNPKLVEVLIAFSIVFLAYEVAKDAPRKLTLTKQYPWLVTFTFGLLHGFGFAGALREIGIPQDEIPMTLFAFNVGVEVGQILFLVGVYFITVLIGQLLNRATRINWLMIRSCAYFIGTASSFWLIERIVA